MRSSLINKGLLQSYIGRFMPLWIAFLAAWLVCLILPLATLAPGSQGLSAYLAGWSMEYAGSLVGCAIAALASACCVFEYLFNRQAAMFAGSLPVKRTALFATAYVAGLVPLLVVELLVFAVVALMTLAMPQIGMQFAVSWLGLTVGFTFVFYSMAVFCAQLCGTRTAAYYLYVLANVFVAFIEFSCRIVATSLMWGVDFASDSFIFIWASPLFGLGYYVFNLAGSSSPCVTALTVNWLALLAYCLFALAITFAAARLNRKRHLERAQNPIAVAGLPSVGKLMGALALAAVACLVSIGCMWVNGGGSPLSLQAGQVVMICVIAVVASLLGSFFAHACLLGAAGSLKGSFKAGAVVAACCVAFALGCHADVLGVESRVPDAADVASIEVGLESETTTLASEDAVSAVIAAHKEALDTKGQAEGTYDDADYYDTFSVEYKLKNGSSVKRSYSIPRYDSSTSAQSDKAKELKASFAKLEGVLDSPEGVLSRYSALIRGDWSYCSIGVFYGAKASGDYKSIQIKSADIQSYVSEALLADIDDSSFGKVYTDEPGETGYLSIDLVGADGDTVYYGPSFTSDNCKAQAKWLKDHYGVDILE